MKDPKRDTHELLIALRERAKELDCLYAIEEAVGEPERPLDDVLDAVLRALAPALLHPAVAVAHIAVGEKERQTPGYRPTPWQLSAPIRVRRDVVGELTVAYLEERPAADIGPFLKEEARLIRTVAERIGNAVEHRSLKAADGTPSSDLSWRASLELLRRTDRRLFMRVVRKLINHMCGMGHSGAQRLLAVDPDSALPVGEVNQPGQRRALAESLLLADKAIEMAASAMTRDELLGLVQKWVQEDKASLYLKVLDRFNSTQAEIAEAVSRFSELLASGGELSQNVMNGVKVSLVRRVLTEQLEYITVAKHELEVQDFGDLFDRMIVPAESHGKVGGKSAGLFLAQRIIDRVRECDPTVSCVKVPKTWYVASDSPRVFIRINDLEEVLEQKYKPIEQVRQEYPNIVQLFKGSKFPPEVVQGLSVALDDLGERPIIVRSSSLLEDRMATPFAGKYKSLFLANQGDKPTRLASLLDAIAEIYASVFAPDPIEYRRERGLLDFNEEMGILLQEVVGQKVGGYFLPAFAGVAFSNNEFRWSPRIGRKDGLVRIVPGLGTRAVDRVSDDYPVLAVPRQPSLRANATVDEQVRYAPHKVDVINLETNSFETLEVADFLKAVGTSYPGFELVFSVLDGDRLKAPSRLLTDPDKDTLAVTFDGLLGSTPFLKQVGRYLELLEERLGTPVDIEFAHDGKDFYLLQCRPQSHADDSKPVPIPKEIPQADLVFGARRFVSNGWVPDITHIVYVDPERYGALATHDELVAVGRAVGRLNKLLPKRQFVLIGPGRWGSRGDIKLGVKVTYSDISNTAMLIEVARRKGQYSPDLSFGTHFFQDLVESRIRYLPLYPDEDDVPWNEAFLCGARSVLEELAPDFARVGDCVRVIDVPAETGGRILRVLQNAELDEAVAFFAAPRAGSLVPPPPGPDGCELPSEPSENHWSWRLRMAERIAADLDAPRFGVAAMYVFGSTKNATAGPGSDIDLLLHVRGDEGRRRELLTWLEGWSLALAEMNYLRTGYSSRGLLDVHLVTDEDIERRTSFAVKIGAVTDAARPLRLKATAS